MPTRFGSALYHGNEARSDAASVSILRSAGALIMGKTTTTEFTVLNAGPKTTNPHDPQRTPGGSSAGSAAAVADLQIPLSLGTQTGGSVIRPASFTGIFAMKPTWNVISVDGIKLVSGNIDTLGFFARNIGDLQMVADVFGLHCSPKDRMPPLDLSELRIALVRTTFWPMAGPGTIAAMDRAADILKKNGVTVEEVDLPAPFSNAHSLKQIHTTILSFEAQSAFLAEYRLDKAKLHSSICHLIEKTDFKVEEARDALDRYAELRSIFDSFADEYTAIITPSAVDVAPYGLHDMGDPCFNFLWTGLHAPVVHIPAFTGEDGLPVGLSVVAGRFRDQYLLKVCTALSRHLISEGGWTVVNTSNDVEIRAPIPPSSEQ